MAVSKIDIKTYYIRAYEKDWSETKYPQDAFVFRGGEGIGVR